MTDLVWFLFSAGGIACLFVAAALWIWFRPQSRSARRFLLAAALFYASTSSYAISHATGRLLAAGLRRFERTDLPQGRAAIVLLGSGTFTARDWEDNRLSVLDPAAAARVLEAVRVFKLTNAEWIISSGGVVHAGDADEPSGLTMADALVRLGIPDERVLIEAKSRNTHDEAVIIRAMLEELPEDHVILVTSELHMRRALGTFKSEGIGAIPAIARAPHQEFPWIRRLIPSERGLAEAALIWHEIIGLGYYVVRGWYRP